MNNLNEINDNINELIMSKSFDRLTDEEKAQALAYVGSEEEYNSLRQTLMAITSSFSEESEEEFAGDEVKSDLMSHFEKKYGTSGNRTKVVPLYRNTYFQLAVAAGLALLVFFSIPMFRPSGDQGDQQLAMANKSDAKDEKVAGTYEETPAASGESMALNNQSESNTGFAAPGKNGKDIESKEKQQDVQPIERSMDKNAELKAEMAPPPPSLSDKDKGTLAAVSENKKVVAQDLSVTKNAGNYDSKLSEEADKMVMDEVTVNNTLSRSVEKEKSEGKKDAASVSKKEKGHETDVNTYSPHTHDFNGGANTSLNKIATTASTGPSRNSMNLVSFVEENKTEMMDLLFTVY